VHLLTLVLFDTGSNRSNVRTIINCQPITEVDEFTDYMPYGCTPLYDAMGQSLTTLRNRIKDDDNASAVVTVLTDGLENSSREWNASMLRTLIEQLKEEGWSFSYMGSAHNVKEVSDLLSIENVVEFSHDQMGASSTWGREQASRMSYFTKMDSLYRKGEPLAKQEKVRHIRKFAHDYYEQRVTPDEIRRLDAHSVVVFGSDEQGTHSEGTAALAIKEYGAVKGVSEGLQGRSYAIPTMEGFDKLAAAVERFTQFASHHQNLRFLVTKVGCDTAGYSVHEIAPLFAGCISLGNVFLPAEFWDALGLKMY